MKPAAPLKDNDHLLNILFFTALLIWIVIAICVSVYPENLFDNFVQEHTHRLATPDLLPFWIRLTFFGSFEFLFPAYVIFIGISIWQRKVRLGLSVASLAICGFLSVELLKQIFHRLRPPAPMIPAVLDYSFPSGHSTSSVIFYSVIAYYLWRTNMPRSLRIAGVSLLILLAASIGLSRIVLAVHYPTDVAAGFCFGMAWLIMWYRFIHQKFQNKIQDV